MRLLERTDFPVDTPAREDASQRVTLVRAREMLAEFRRRMAERDRSADVQEVAFRVATSNAREFKRVIKIDLPGLQPSIAPAIDAFRERNVSLITRMTQETLDQIEQVVDRAWDQGLRVEELREQLRERFEVSKSRADLIARDQVLKLNSQVTRTRQQSAGISRYVWTTSGDERVRGNPSGLYPNSDRDHYSLDGRTFSWDAPPVVNQKTGETAHPGEDYQCRCVATPVLDFLEESPET